MQTKWCSVSEISSQRPRARRRVPAGASTIMQTQYQKQVLPNDEQRKTQFSLA